MFESKKCKMLFKVTVHVNALIYHNRQFVENDASMFKKAICKKELVKQYQTKKKKRNKSNHYQNNNDKQSNSC